MHFLNFELLGGFFYRSEWSCLKAVGVFTRSLAIAAIELELEKEILGISFIELKSMISNDSSTNTNFYSFSPYFMLSVVKDFLADE